MGMVDLRDLPPHLQVRYGVRSTPRWQVALAILVVASFVGAIAWVAYTIGRPQIQYQLLLFNDIGSDRVDITFEVRRGAGQDVYCVLRAQDARRIDVGYAQTAIPRGTTYAQETYRMRVLAPATFVEVLGCEAGGPPTRVPPPQFPPGVAPPPQPWSPG